MTRPRVVTVWAPVVAAGLVCAIVAAVVVGWSGWWGSVVGLCIVMLFFASSPLALVPLTRVTPHLSLIVALIFYATKVVALLALMGILVGPGAVGDALHPTSLGVTVIVTTLLHTVLAVRAATRERVPLYDLGNSSGNTPDTLRRR